MTRRRRSPRPRPIPRSASTTAPTGIVSAAWTTTAPWRDESKRLQGKDRSYIKGQRYTLLGNRENLSLDGRKALRKLLAANKRLNTAYC
jgi:hypothetical protein